MPREIRRSALNIDQVQPKTRLRKAETFDRGEDRRLAEPNFGAEVRSPSSLVDSHPTSKEEGQSPDQGLRRMTNVMRCQ